MIDRAQVAKALADLPKDWPADGVTAMPIDSPILAAARAWLDQGDALIIRRDENLQPAIRDAIRQAHDQLEMDSLWFWKVASAVINTLDALSDRSDK